MITKPGKVDFPRSEWGPIPADLGIGLDGSGSAVLQLAEVTIYLSH
jgi:hypothetical protein